MRPHSPHTPTRNAAAGPGYARTPDWRPSRSLRGQAAVPVGGGRARASTRTPGHARLEAVAEPAGPGRGAGGRRQGQGKHTHTRPRPIGARRVACGARPRCRWAAAGPGRASRRRARPHPSGQAPPVWRAPEGPEGTGGNTRTTSTPDWRPPRGLGGLAGLRDDAPSEARSADGERAVRPRGGRRSGGPQPQQAAPRAAAAQ